MVLFESGLIILGGQVFTNLIGDTSSKVVSVIESALQFQHTDIHEVLVELDLEVRLEVIGSLIKCITPEKHNEAIGISLQSIHKSITKIQEIMEQVELKIKEHSEKYFNSYRTLDFDREIKDIQQKSSLLEKRFQLLVDLMKIESNN